MNPMRRIVERRIPERHDGVAHVFVDRALLPQDDVGHRRQIFVEERREFDRGEAFGQRGERPDVAEHQSQLALLPAELQLLRMLGEAGDDGGRHIPAERRTDLVHLLPLLAVELPDARQEHKAGGKAGHDRIDEDAVPGERVPAGVTHGGGGGGAEKRGPIDRE